MIRLGMNNAQLQEANRLLDALQAHVNLMSVILEEVSDLLETARREVKQQIKQGAANVRH